MFALIALLLVQTVDPQYHGRVADHSLFIPGAIATLVLLVAKVIFIRILVNSAGKDRALVLRAFADRGAVDDISSFVTVVIQSSAFRNSIGQALRAYAAELRDKRVKRAEMKASVLPINLTLGSMAFTMPALMLILAEPSLIQVVRSLKQFGSGQ